MLFMQNTRVLLMLGGLAAQQLPRATNSLVVIQLIKLQIIVSPIALDLLIQVDLSIALDLLIQVDPIAMDL